LAFVGADGIFLFLGSMLLFRPEVFFLPWVGEACLFVLFLFLIPTHQVLFPAHRGRGPFFGPLLDLLAISQISHRSFSSHRCMLLFLLCAPRSRSQFDLPLLRSLWQQGGRPDFSFLFLALVRLGGTACARGFFGRGGLDKSSRLCPLPTDERPR